MRKSVYLAIILLTALPAGAQQVLHDGFSNLRLRYESPEIKVDATGLYGEKYITLSADGYIQGGDIGSPAMPVLPATIVIPFCDELQVTVENAVYDTIDLDYGLQLLPAQPGIRKDDTSLHKAILDEKAYQSNVFSDHPLALVQTIGIARDRRLANITFAPVRINAVSKKAIVCRSADITVTYINPDSTATLNHYRRYHSHAFNFGATLNKLISTKDGASSNIIRFTIVSPSSLRCQRLEQFAQWKRRTGMMVDLLYYDEMGLSSNTDIANAIKALYTNASEEAPAPTYLLLVGDREQLPAFSSNITPYYPNSLNNNHITDLYYVTWTDSDIIPDCLQGRFSATDTITLARIISKTLLYESYSFADDNYLCRGVLVSGVDQSYTNNTSDNAYTYSDPSMDYIAKYYVRSSSGFNDVRYYKNRTTFAPQGVTVSGSSRSDSASLILRNLYNEGFGWINYSAHGNWNEWSIPKFNTTHAGEMANRGMPSFMIGNCCLSGKFDKSACLGEALLRRGDNAGAVAYIGATNSTYWGEDFYWTVGVRGNISGTMNATYDATNLGVYDRLFHTHGEPTSQQVATAGAMILQGNMAVNSTVGTSWGRYVVPYYWEIYELFGDPSLMPWLGKAKTIPFSIDTSSREINISAVGGAYIALINSVTLNVVCATTADSYGMAKLQLPDTADLSKLFFAATAQGYRPFIQDIDKIKNGIIEPVKTYPNPSSDGIVIVSGTDIRSIKVYDSRGYLVTSVTTQSDFYRLDLSAMQPGFYTLLVETADGPSGAKIILE